MTINKKKYCMSIYYIFTNFCLNILSYIEGVSNVKYLVILLINVILVLNIGGLKKVRLHSATCIFFLYQIYLVIITQVRGYPFNNCQGAIQMAISLWLVKTLVAKSDVKIFFKASYDVCKFVLPLNCLLCIIFSNGFLMGANGVPIYLFGNKNTMGATIIGLIILCLMYSFTYYGRVTKTVNFVCVCGGVSCVITWSATTIIGIIIIAVYLFFMNKKHVRKVFAKIGPKSSFVLGALLCLGINILNLQYYFSFLIEDVLKKSINFSARTYIWDKVMELIPIHFVLGQGYYSSEILATEYFVPVNAHSFFLEVLLSGGLIGFLFILLLFRKFDQAINKIKIGMLKELLCLYILLVMVTGVSESTNLFVFFYMFIIIADEQVQSCVGYKYRIRGKLI